MNGGYLKLGLDITWADDPADPTSLYKVPGFDFNLIGPGVTYAHYCLTIHAGVTLVDSIPLYVHGKTTGALTGPYYAVIRNRSPSTGGTARFLCPAEASGSATYTTRQLIAPGQFIVIPDISHTTVLGLLQHPGVIGYPNPPPADIDLDVLLFTRSAY